MAEIPDWLRGELALKHQRLLEDVRVIVTGSESMSELGQRLTASVRFALNVDACVARLVVDGQLRLLGETGLPPGTAEEWMNASEGIAGRMLAERRPLTIGNAAAHSATARLYSMSKDNPKKFQFMSYAGAPMLVEAEAVGVLGLFTVEQSRYFSEQDLEHLQAIANMVGEAVMEYKAERG